MDNEMLMNIRVNAIYKAQTIKNGDVKNIIIEILNSEGREQTYGTNDIEILEDEGDGHYNIRLFNRTFEYLIMHMDEVKPRWLETIEDNICYYDTEALWDCLKDDIIKSHYEPDEDEDIVEGEQIIEEDDKDDLENAYDSTECCVCYDNYEVSDKIFIHCGHSLCRDCHNKLCDGSRKCPHCRTEFLPCVEKDEGYDEEYEEQDIEELVANENSEVLFNIIDTDKLYDRVLNFGTINELFMYDNMITDYDDYVIMWR